jgi:septal ring-binding cell division protein DamX
LIREIFMIYRCTHPSKNALVCILLFVCLAVSICLLLGSCSKSKDEPTQAQKPGKIVRSIRKSIPAPSVPVKEAAEEGQAQSKPKADPISQKGLAEKQKEAADTTRGIKSPGPEDQSEIMQAITDTSQTADAMSKEEQPEIPQQVKPVQEGIYRVQKDDTLSKIAERIDVYGNPLKWTSLFRHNMGNFEDTEPVRDFQNQRLPEGLELKFVTASKASENRAIFGNTVFSVNVLSAETSEKIVPLAIILLKNGYNAYICTATVKGKEWMRLRVGFFKNRSAAAKAGKQISTVVQGMEIWVVKISNTEIQDYCGY